MLPVHELTPDQIRAELDVLQASHGFERPSRSKIDSTRPWKNGAPNYDKADLLFFRGKTMNHAAGSLESVVENAVKSWEMEATHLNYSDWKTVDHSTYRVCANGARTFVGEESAKVGNYNWLMNGCDKSVYNADEETFESSHALFGGAFLGGFPWEVLQVFSGPPRIAFSWRHWADFRGEYKGRSGDGKMYEMYGFGVVELSEKSQIKSIEIYYKPNEFIKALQGHIDPKDLHHGQSVVGSGCPIFHKDS